MKRVCVIGGGGQLGSDLVRAFAAAGFPVTVPSRNECDVTDEASLARTFERERPDLVINTAWLPVAHSERDPREAERVNAEGAGMVSDLTQKHGAIVIYISTDYVFDGERGEYAEDDAPHPINTYGETKLRGEELTRAGGERHLIIRTSAIFGAFAAPLGNFVEKMRARAQAGEQTHVVNDQFTKPTYARDLADRVVEMVVRGVPFGVYHVTGDGASSWYEFARAIFAAEGRTDLVFPSATEEKEGEMRRPRKSTLKNAKLKSLGFAPLPPWQDALTRYLKERAQLSAP